MAVDFDALDLVRTQNKARSYNKRVDHLQMQNKELCALAEDLIKEMPEGNRKMMYQERFKENLKILLDKYPISSLYKECGNYNKQKESNNDYK